MNATEAAAEAAIARLRRNIDEVDEVLVKLLNQRAKWALEIGGWKKSASIPIYQPDREARVVAHVVGCNRGPLAADAVQRLFERIIDESRRLERIAEVAVGRAVAERAPAAASEGPAQR